MNSTLPSTLAHMTVALTNQLFWDIPVERRQDAARSVSACRRDRSCNCRFPAACGVGAAGRAVPRRAVQRVPGEDALRRRAARRRERDLEGLLVLGRAGHVLRRPQSRGHAHGRRASTTSTAAALGATPTRDGVDTGGHTNIPSGGISDVERMEMQYPFVYFGRNHRPDGGGYGTLAGRRRQLAPVHGAYGSPDLTVDFSPTGAFPRAPSACSAATRRARAVLRRSSRARRAARPPGAGALSGYLPADGSRAWPRARRSASPGQPRRACRSRRAGCSRTSPRAAAASATRWTASRSAWPTTCAAAGCRARLAHLLYGVVVERGRQRWTSRRPPRRARGDPRRAPQRVPPADAGTAVDGAALQPGLRGPRVPGARPRRRGRLPPLPALRPRASATRAENYKLYALAARATDGGA